ncbi:MAG TPA: NADH-quinone oxidoreductase subunit NuoH [Chitinophagaceae bacterium]|nr:NADH-quinone oxidoreductase subunit NuoH [Chitinophagaceae bacterium]MCC6634619.1 NADH-quinone oxidoreductase subunit NuoH [Chitinophagaceae bacterium]HNE94131.1 NADH-quinone oxidoreductase subunit NuoH [Chitinophagaceae bacterium]HNN30280.1 NADH-quinone oxidoreductase subunit NuoH [Chitinophagaceae bacterium]
MTFLTIDWLFIIEKLVLIIIIILASLGIALYTTFAERKVAAILQDRPGPNRAGPFGLLQPLADGVKMFTKEEIVPTHASKWLFILGPGLAMVASLMTCAVIPWGGSVELFDRKIDLQVADINIAVLYIFAVVSLGIYGIMIGGWASNNKFSLMAVLRAASQAISYELAMGLSLIAVLMITGTLSLNEMVKQQQEGLWNIVYQPLGFLLFFICALAECNRTPFDLPEAESELNFGYHQEYSSMKLGFYLFAEYINMIMSSAVMATLYFGGYDIPFVNDANLYASIGNWAALLQVTSILIKIVIFIFVFMWIRWTIPRFRYDQLMDLGWKKMVPLALFNMLVTAFIVLLKHNGWKF